MGAISGLAKGCIVAELTDEQVAREREFLDGMPRLNIGALFLPAIWGPAHGIWAAILFYPVWLLADNTLYAALSERTPLAIGLAVVVLAVLVALTVAFAIIGQPIAAHRAAGKGVTRDLYLKRERVWAVVCVILGVAMIAAATFYNLAIRPTLGE